MSIENVGRCATGAHGCDTPQAGRTGMAARLFDKIDTAGDGALTKADLKASLDTVTISPQGAAAAKSATDDTAGLVDKLMAKLDGNKDGAVTADEFKSALMQARRAHHARHAHHHAHDDAPASTSPAPVSTPTTPAQSTPTTTPAATPAPAATPSTAPTTAAGSTTTTTIASTVTPSMSMTVTETRTDAPAAAATPAATPQKLALATPSLDALFKKLDLNRDGKVTKQEFTDALKQADDDGHAGRHGHRVHHGRHRHAHHAAQIDGAKPGTPASTTVSAPTPAAGDATATTATPAPQAAQPGTRESGLAVLRVMKMLDVYADAGTGSRKRAVEATA